MKVFDQFKCEYCGTVYLEEQGCLDCEASHAEVEIAELKYSQRSKFPEKVVLTCPDDGTKQVYVKA